MPTVTVRPTTGPCKGTRLRRRLVIRFVDPVASRFVLGGLATRLPRVPRRLRAGINPPGIAWPTPSRETPAELRTVPGIRRIPEKEEQVFREAPLKEWFGLHEWPIAWLIRRWSWFMWPLVSSHHHADQ